MDDDDRLGWVKRNAAHVVAISQGLGDVRFGYDEQSVASLENYIVRMRKRGDFLEHNCDTLSVLYGCYLGEAMIARHGGVWQRDDDQEICVLYEGDFRFYPCAKVAKLIKNGLEGGDSILAFYTGVPMFIAMAKANRGNSD
jgi:hypothetical protein